MAASVAHPLVGKASGRGLMGGHGHRIHNAGVALQRVQQLPCGGDMMGMGDRTMRGRLAAPVVRVRARH